MKYCYECGTKRIELAKFCYECGSKFQLVDTKTAIIEPNKDVKVGNEINRNVDIKEQLEEARSLFHKISKELEVLYYELNINEILEPFERIYISHIESGGRESQLLFNELMEKDIAPGWTNTYTNLPIEYKRKVLSLLTINPFLLIFSRNDFTYKIIDEMSIHTIVKKKLKEDISRTFNFLQNSYSNFAYQQNPVVNGETVKIWFNRIKGKIKPSESDKDLIEIINLMEECMNYNYIKIAELVRYMHKYKGAKYDGDRLIKDASSKVSDPIKVLDIVQFILEIGTPLSAAKYIVKKINNR